MKRLRQSFFIFIPFALTCGKTTTASLPASQPASAPSCTSASCPVTIAEDQNGAYAITIDTNNVYWTTLIDGTVMQAPITSAVGSPSAASGASGGSGSVGSGGNGEAIMLASGQVSPFAIAVNFQAVYWATQGAPGQTTAIANKEGTVNGVVIGNIGGNSEITTLATTQNFPLPVGLVAGGSTVFWPTLGGSPTQANGAVAAIASIPPAGTKPSTYFGNLSNPTGIALDTKYFYVSEKGGIKPGDGAILKVPYTYNSGTLSVASKSAVVLAQPASLPTALTVDFNNVYYVGTEAGVGVVMSASLTTGAVPPALPPAPTTLATGGQPVRIAVDTANVYWTDTTAGTVMRVPIAGGTPTTLVSGQDGPVGVAVDATNVYWTTASAVMRMALPP